MSAVQIPIGKGPRAFLFVRYRSEAHIELALASLKPDRLPLGAKRASRQTAGSTVQVTAKAFLVA